MISKPTCHHGNEPSRCYLCKMECSQRFENAKQETPQRPMTYDELLAALQSANAALRQSRENERRLREALRDTSRLLERYEEEPGYGFARPDNPHDFSPDQESCTEAEIAAHRASCEAYDRGEYTPPRGSETIRDEKGEMVLHILRAPWGIGSYVMRDPDISAALTKARTALAATEPREER